MGNRNVPTEYTVRVWRSGTTVDDTEKWVCKTWDDVLAAISDVDQPVDEGRVKIEIEEYEVMG